MPPVCVGHTCRDGQKRGASSELSTGGSRVSAAGWLLGNVLCKTRSCPGWAQWLACQPHTQGSQVSFLVKGTHLGYRLIPSGFDV